MIEKCATDLQSLLNYSQTFTLILYYRAMYFANVDFLSCSILQNQSSILIFHFLFLVFFFLDKIKMCWLVHKNWIEFWYWNRVWRQPLEMNTFVGIKRPINSQQTHNQYIYVVCHYYFGQCLFAFFFLVHVHILNIYWYLFFVQK